MDATAYLIGTDALGVLSENAPSARTLLDPYASETPPALPAPPTPAPRAPRAGGGWIAASLLVGACLGAYLLRSRSAWGGAAAGAFAGWLAARAATRWA